MAAGPSGATRPPLSAVQRVSLAGLVAMMAGAGMIHLVNPKFYLKAVPRGLGNEELIVFVSGVAELILAATLIFPRSRRLGAQLTALFLIAVFPANVQMAIDGPVADGNWFTGSSAALWLRLPIQPVLILWAWTFAREKPAP